MYLVIAYDVRTDTKEGRRRLRQVAKACESRGQRVQKSVFEVKVSEAGHEALVDKLVQIIEPKEDTLRVYRLVEPHDEHIEHYGCKKSIDFDEPLVL